MTSTPSEQVSRNDTEHEHEHWYGTGHWWDTPSYSCGDDGVGGRAVHHHLYDDLFPLSLVLIAALGTVANGVSIPVLLSKNLKGAFYKILAFLAVADTLFLLCCLWTSLRTMSFRSALHVNLQYFEAGAYAYAILGSQSVFLFTSIYMTVGLALERYLALTRPLSHMTNTQGNQLVRVAKFYAGPALVMGILFNVVRFLEAEVVIYDDGDASDVMPTKFRKDASYVLARTVGKLIVTGLIPLVLLTFFNIRIYQILRQQMAGGGAFAAAAAAYAAHEARMKMEAKKKEGDNKINENGATPAAEFVSDSSRHVGREQSGSHCSKSSRQQAVVLFSVVIVFFVTNAPRIVIDLWETTNHDSVIDSYESGCSIVPSWVLDFSKFMLVLNSSTNFLVYSLMSAPFRRVLVAGACYRCCKGCCGVVGCVCNAFCKDIQD